MPKFKHRQTGDIAQLIEAPTPFYRTGESNWYIDPKYVEKSSDREEIKETPEYADNGMYIGDKRGDINTSVSISNCFDTKENADRWIKKQNAERNIRKRKAENDGEWEADWDDQEQLKWFPRYDNKYKEICTDYYSYTQTNNIYFSEEGIKKAEEEIKDDLIIYLTY